jgi:hypothetical protein
MLRDFQTTKGDKKKLNEEKFILPLIVALLRHIISITSQFKMLKNGKDTRQSIILPQRP